MCRHTWLVVVYKATTRDFGNELMRPVTVKSRWYWHIEGYEGTKKFFGRQVNYSQFSEAQIRAVLMALAAKGGLTYNEIINAYASARAPAKNELLHVHRSFGPRPTYTCGDDPSFSATPIKK